MAKKRGKTDNFRYFLVGQVPVKVSYRETGFRQPFRAEVVDQKSGELTIDNAYLGEIDDGEDVSDISETQFQQQVQGFLRQSG